MRRKIDITRCHRKIYRCHMRGTATGGGWEQGRWHPRFVQGSGEYTRAATCRHVGEVTLRPYLAVGRPRQVTQAHWRWRSARRRGFVVFSKAGTRGRESRRVATTCVSLGLAHLCVCGAETSKTKDAR
jgi:hypothetical protein